MSDRPQIPPPIVRGHSGRVSHKLVIYIPSPNNPKVSPLARLRGAVFEKWLTLSESPYTKRDEKTRVGVLA